MPVAGERKKRMPIVEEARRATRMLKGKTVRVIRRHRQAELLVEFEDGTRLFVDATSDGLDVSIT